MVGGRDAYYAELFMQDLAPRLKHRVQLTSDGRRAYLKAVPAAFGHAVDFAQLVKYYGKGEPKKKTAQARYSPPQCTGTKRLRVIGDPDPRHVSTSYMERANLTIRMHNRRFTRLTNAFSKKIENHNHSLALHFAYYNLCRKHQTLGTSPAVAAGVEDHVWSLEELVGLLEKAENSN